MLVCRLTCAFNLEAVDSCRALTSSCCRQLLCQVLSWFNFYCSVRTFSNCMEAALTAAVMCFWPWPGRNNDDTTRRAPGEINGGGMSDTTASSMHGDMNDDTKITTGRGRDDSNLKVKARLL